MAMMRGNTYGLAVKLAMCGGKEVDMDTVEKVQFAFRSDAGVLEKFYEADGSGEVEWDDDAGVFIVNLTEQETFAFKNKVDWQLRVMFEDGSVKGTRIKSEYLYDSITNRVLNSEESDEGGGEDEE